MQWTFRGRPTWTAPRAIGLAFTPVLAAIVLALGVARNEDGPILLLVEAYRTPKRGCPRVVEEWLD